VVKHSLWNDGGTWQALLTTKYTITTQDVAREMYGVPSSGIPRGFNRWDLPASQRLGVLTHPSLMSALGTEEEAELVQRGKFIRERLLCQAVPAPPPTVNAAFPLPDPNLTHRERFDVHRADPTCNSCHRVLDPYGYGFEVYSAIGSWLSTDKGKPVDARGTLVGTSKGDIAYDGPLDLISKLVALPDVQDCVLRQTFRFFAGRQEAPGDTCQLARAKASFDASKGNVLELAADIVSSDELITRSK
jgi:hypothetical protein